MPITVTPVLSSTDGYVLDVRDQTMSLIRFLIYNPGGISDLWEKDLISFRTYASTWESVRSDLAGQLSSAVKRRLSAMFPEYGIDTNFTTEDYDDTKDNGAYTIKFEITLTPPNTSLTESALITGTASINIKNNDITLNFDRSVDTASLI